MILRLALAVAGGLCLWLSFPGPAIWPAAIVGVALLALATKGTRVRTGFLLGLVGGFACFGPTLHWAGTYVGAVPWLALAITESVYLALMGMACSLVQSARRWELLPQWLSPADGPHVRPLAIALLWVLQEAVRDSMPFGGFPWARLAWSTAGSPIAHLASIFGAPGLTFVVALLGGWLALTVDRVRRGMPPARAILPRLWPVVAGVAVVGLAVVYPTPTSGKKMQVLAIQGNVPTAGLEFNAQRRAVLDNHVKVTDAAAKKIKDGTMPEPALVIWPENSSDIDPTRNADAGSEIVQTVDRIGVPLIVGAVLTEPAPQTSNTSLLYLPDKGITDRYVKQHPVPFAEYMPYRSFFRHFSSAVDLAGNFAAGHETGLFRVPTKHNGTVKVAPVICFEVAYDSLTRNPVKDGAQILAVQTNNATFGKTAESEQQLAISRVRAIELGRSIVHISTVGVSGLISPDGVVHGKTELFTPEAVAGALPLRTNETLAVRLGALPEWLGCAAALLLCGVALGGNRSARRRSLSAKEVHELV
ncbi:apolipoprotein N-acyltransferase [Flexivirga endophytica]|uniref:Apolipoprotein N-acyltransferase n=1 Tax=Flexivirga endophytica TaxID=1849103 RepID=A0A916T8R1_9MICO|nr:apolipoprotein N-acyltransferase [Flexivirga endophytica]GGB35985.1 apolipoprotein N-acyltransferase [Flexivirga endophytica]GHB43768.1 apolipoprotein N-acyltransferase [Flexivirga endophytica]